MDALMPAAVDCDGGGADDNGDGQDELRAAREAWARVRVCRATTGAQLMAALGAVLAGAESGTGLGAGVQDPAQSDSTQTTVSTQAPGAETGGGAVMAAHVPLVVVYARSPLLWIRLRPYERRALHARIAVLRDLLGIRVACWLLPRRAARRWAGWLRDDERP
ncbi:hypothetical protein HK105_208509 [Polyrhizophydium stewartii]|uniref:Uncharacterized protein n=1 Tax=Polyrhizophydium stewartii TaxID=2732419 RepID=A0ABR4MXT0_9FUNG